MSDALDKVLIALGPTLKAIGELDQRIAAGKWTELDEFKMKLKSELILRMAPDAEAVVRRMRASFKKSVDLMKEVKRKNKWPAKRWVDWMIMRDKALAKHILIARHGIKTKNKVIEQILGLL